MKERWVSPLFALALGAIWELVSRLGWLSPVLVSSPTRIGRAAFGLSADPFLISDLSYTLQVFVIAVAIASAAGAALGLWIGWSRVAYQLFNPVLVAANAIPKIALMPLVVLWVGIGKPAGVLLATLMASFPVVIATASGLHALERDHVLVARAFGASTKLTLQSVVLPGVAPYVVSGLRVGVNYALVGVLIAEFFASSRGIGYRMIAYMSNFEVDAFFVCLLMIAVFSLALSALLTALERKLLSWRPDAFEPAQL